MVLGLALSAYFPFSVSRLATESLDALPLLVAQPEDTNNGAFAMFDGDFILATRTYDGVDRELVETAMLASGFDVLHGPTPSQNGFSKPCCGEYDALFVHLSTVDGTVVATTTAADSDVVIAGPMFLVLGGFVAAFGILMARRRPNHNVESAGVVALNPAMTGLPRPPGN